MNEKKTAMIAKSKVKRNGPTFCSIDGGLVDRNKKIDPNHKNASSFIIQQKLENQRVIGIFKLKIEKSTEVDALSN